MKKGLLVAKDTLIELPFFKEIFEKWGIAFTICSNPEIVLMKINIDRPDFVLLSTDLDMDYSKTLDFIFSKNCSVIFFGSKPNKFSSIQSSHIKGSFPLPVELDLIKLKNIFFPSTILKVDLLSGSISHIDFVTSEKIGIVELEGNISWEKIHELKFHILQLFYKQEIKGLIFIFKYIENSDPVLFDNIHHLFSFLNSATLRPSKIQVISVEERIRTMIKIQPQLEKIEFSNSYADAFLKIQEKEYLIDQIGVSTSEIDETTTFPEDMYSEFGELLKSKDEKLTNEELLKLKFQNIFKIYKAEDLLKIGVVPLAAGNDSNNPSIPSKSNGTIKVNKKLVVIIDDDSIALKLLKILIQNLYFDVITANTGVEGFQYVTTNTPDLIIVDLMMPGFNGVDFIKTYKEIKGKEAAPIIVVSAITRKEIIQQLIEYGIKDYLVKPIDVKLLTQKISKIIPSAYAT